MLAQYENLCRQMKSHFFELEATTTFRRLTFKQNSFGHILPLYNQHFQ
jgi:hypothetical protein